MLEKALCAVCAGRFFDVKNKDERGVSMYPVSEAFLTTVQENTRSFYWTGRINTKAGAVYEFGNKDIVKGSGYITSQCCGSTEIEIGTVYAAEMGITLLSEIDRYTLEDGKIELFYHLLLGNGAEETVPLGIFEISEANRIIRCLEIKAYDYMLRFEKSLMDLKRWGMLMRFWLCGAKPVRWNWYIPSPGRGKIKIHPRYKVLSGQGKS